MAKLKTFTVDYTNEFGIGTYKTKGAHMQDAYDRLSPKKQKAVMSITDEETEEEYFPHLYNDFMTWEEFKADQELAKTI